jgi:hypothetical protein
MPDRNETPRLGLPYARAEVRGGRLYAVCPVCGHWCPDEHDEAGEPTTNSYAHHYLMAHGDGR